MKHIISILALLLCASSSAQSIMISGGGQSITVSGSAATEATKAPEKPADHEIFREVSEAPKPAPVSVQAKTEPPAVTSRQVTQRFLVSESWCPSCPAAKARFLAAGNPSSNVLTIAQARSRFGISVPHVPYEFTQAVSVQSSSQPVRQSAPVQRQRLPVVRTQWGTIDLESYNRNCNCSMCQGIRALQQQYRSYQPTSFVPEPAENLPADQQPTPDLVIDDMLSLMGLTSVDTLADIGCGDGRVLVAAARRYGCRGVGIEIDETQAQRARQAVSAAGLSGKIQIITGDARQFDPQSYGVTAITVYLYPELLVQLAPKLKSARVVASPFHEVPGLNMSRRGDVWITTAARQASGEGFPGFDRQAEIDHLMDPATQHAGRFRRADLERMTDWQLIDIHNREHGVITHNGVRS